MKNIKNKSILRFLALVLALASILTVSPVSVLANGEAESTDADAPKIMILHNGAQRLSITLNERESELLSVFTTSESKLLDWQIRIPETDVWVNISGKNEFSLKVTYSIIGSMLDNRGRAALRCKLTEDDKAYYSDPVEVILAYDASEDVKAPLNISHSPVAAHKMPMQNNAEDFELVSIVINYIFDNGGMAFEPYGASIAKGTDFSTVVDSPKVAGYDPFIRVDGEYVDADKVTLDYTNIQENVVINVIYLPALVEYQVHHHLQDLYDDAYSETADYITKHMALTGSTTPKKGLELSLPGFSVLSYEQITVAADGSTVVEIRYDRNYYLVDFNMNGGYGTEPIYTRYGSEVGANDPTKHGYRFDGWELIRYGDNAPTVQQASQYDINSALITVPDANLTYKAKWITLPTTYTMVFWCENINDNGFTYAGYLGDIPAMSGDIVSGDDRINEAENFSDGDMFTYCEPLTDKNVIVEGDGSTVVNVYYTRNRYAITFKAKGLCAIPENHTHTHDDCYVLMCKGGHVHTADCKPYLACPRDEHTVHTDDCIICGKEAHSHSTACCGLVDHTHTKDCWSGAGNVTNKPSRAPNNPQNGYIYKQNNSNIYIYLLGSWYRYSGFNLKTGDIIDPSCDLEEHVHGSEDCVCKKEVHSHTDSCYKDTLHTHGDECYAYSCGMQAHAHTNDCYVLNCGIPENHKHSSTCKSSSSTNTVKIVYEKYQADLSDIWPVTDDNGKTYNSGERWKPSSSSYFTQVLVYIANMPGDDFTLTLDNVNYDTFTMMYYLEVLPKDAAAGNYDVEVDGKYFELHETIKANYNYLTKEEDFFEINGYYRIKSSPAFKSDGTLDINGGGTVKMYYGRNVSQKLEFQNNGDVVSSQSGIMYGDTLIQFKDFVPEYPDNLEKNAYVFGGWYTSPGCYDGTEVDWNTVTMAAGNVMFYAKWAPIVHEVKIYLTSDLAEQIGETQYVNHRNFASAPNQAVVNGGYVFQGWFYTEIIDGQVVEKAFVFNGIPVIQNMNIYAKWSSHVSVDYTINYVCIKRDNQGNEISRTVIADKTVGTAIAGQNKTFYAKAGSELYAGYTTGYYPLASSHTITMSVDGNHEYTFEYVFVESMPYAVKYINKTTGEAVFEQKSVFENNLSVVTETFISKTGMMPDAYQKRLVLSASGADADNDDILDNNVITFYYTENTTDAFYRVVHYIHDINDNNYREYRSEEKIGKIGESFSVSALTLTGFSFNGALTKINGTVSPTNQTTVTTTLGKNGALIEFFYDRVNVNYTVRYLEQGTNKPLLEEKHEKGIYGGQIVENAPKLTHRGYSSVGDESKRIILSMNEGANVITFYYEESTYSLQYVLVGSPEGATLSMTSENVNAVTGVPNGATPYIKDGYRFVGWYLDADCTLPIDSAWINEENLHMTPQKSGEVWLANTTYYAKVEPNVTSLTISTSGMDEIDQGQIFIYRIQGTSERTNHIDLTVTVNGNSSITIVDLELGEYKVTEISDWSFRYKPDAAEKSIALQVDKTKNKVEFSHARIGGKWLDGNNDVINNFN